MSASISKTILVFGATGKQGSAVIDALLASNDNNNINILAVTRDRTSRGSQALARKPNVSIIEGDLVNADAIFDQATASGNRVWGVFGVQVNSPDEAEQGTSLVTISVARGVQYFVYASGDRGGPEISETDPTFVKNFAAKFSVEKHLRKLAATSPQDMTYAILRPVTFFENMTVDIHGMGFARMWEQMGSKPLQLISTTDIGFFAAQAFLHPDKYHNVAITLVGDELTQPEADIIFKEVVGSSGMPMVPCPVGSAVKFFKKDTVGDMFRWFEKNGYGGDVAQCRKVHPELMNYRSWLAERSPFVQRASR